MKRTFFLAMLLGLPGQMMVAAAEDVVLTGGVVEYADKELISSTKDAVVKGAALSSESAVTITGAESVSFSGNVTKNSYASSHTTADRDLAAGGAVYGASVTLSGNEGDISFTDNVLRAKTTNDSRSRVRGGALKGGTVTISGNKGRVISFSGNAAYDDYKGWDASVGAQVDKPRFSSGGAIYADSGLSISGNSGVEVSFCANQGGKGGAIAAGYGGMMTIADNGAVSFCDNVAEYGGAAYTGGYVYLNSSNTAGKGMLLISGNTGVTFSGNSARNNGGAIYNQVDSTVSISSNLGDVSFSGNTATLYGGAVRGQSGSTLVIDANRGRVVFDGNKVERTDVTAVYGGAVSVDSNSTVSLSGNDSVNLTGNAVRTNSSAYGGAVSVYNSSLDINDNTSGVTISGNSATATKTSSWGSGVIAAGGAVYGKTLTIKGNGGTVDVSANVAEAVNDGTATGAAFYLQESLTISGNDKVVFRGNVQKDTSQTILRSVYLDSKSASGSLNLSAAAGGSITFYDSLYAAPNSSTYSLAVDFNKESGDTGSVCFSGLHAAADLGKVKSDYTADELAASRTSEIKADAVVHRGTLSVEDSAVLKCDNLSVLGGAGFSLKDAAFESTGALTLESAAVMLVEGSSLISSAAVNFAEGSVFNLKLGAQNMQSALLSLATNQLTYGSATVNFLGVSDLAEGQYLLMDLGASSIASTVAEWGTDGITLNGLGEGDFFEWSEDGTLLYLVHAAVPEPATAALSLLALAGLAMRRRRL